MMQIGKNNDKFKQMKDLLKSNNKDVTITSDLQVLEIAINFNLEIELLFYVNDIEYKKETKELLNKLINKSKETYEISFENFKSLRAKENQVGIIASIKFNKYKLEDFKNKDFIVVLDGIEIPGNMGTIYRTLDSTNVDGIIIVNKVTNYKNDLVTSSSRGCNLIIPTIELDYDLANKFLIENNYDIYLAEPELGKSYKEYDYKTKTALVVGNERYGIDNNWYNNKHLKVFLPMSGHQNSLNVGVALSVIAYEIYTKKMSK